MATTNLMPHLSIKNVKNSVSIWQNCGKEHSCSLIMYQHVLTQPAIQEYKYLLKCHVRHQFLLNLTGSCPNSINVDRFVFALQRRPIALSTFVYMYAVIAMKPMHRLQIHPIVHNQRARPTIPLSYIRVCSVVQECSTGETDTHRQLQPIYFLPWLCLT